VIIRNFVLSIKKDGIIIEKREITQLQYLGWPDFGVPKDLRSYVHLFDIYREFRKNLPSGPITVHCRYVFLFS
jgi:protein tyrosine phosphatase